VGDEVYQKGDHPDYMYILLKGALSMTTTVLMSDTNQIPAGMNRWESYTTEKTVQYQVRRILVDEIFGHQEVIEFLQREKDSEVNPELKLKEPVSRHTTVTAIAPSTVIMLRKDYFLQCKYQNFTYFFSF
jgi:CRP-like cAMP-binding protein